MKTNFEVGDDIWWLDTRCIDKPKIRHNIILEVEWEKYYPRHKYVLNDGPKTYIWSPNTLVAKTKEELIDLLCPLKIGPFEFNQLVYVLDKNDNHITITKGYVAVFDCNFKDYSHYVITNKPYNYDSYDSYEFSLSVKEEDIYSSIELVWKALTAWRNNDN